MLPVLGAAIGDAVEQLDGGFGLRARTGSGAIEIRRAELLHGDDVFAIVGEANGRHRALAGRVELAIRRWRDDEAGVQPEAGRSASRPAAGSWLSCIACGSALAGDSRLAGRSRHASRPLTAAQS